MPHILDRVIADCRQCLAQSRHAIATGCPDLEETRQRIAASQARDAEVRAFLRDQRRPG
jgi:hypothetical protein